MDAIHAQVNAAWARKVGGLLLGRSQDGRVTVEGALPAKQAEEHAGEIAFPPSVWEEAYAALDRYPGGRIIGWYHSHPGTGVALSDYDRRLHATLFADPTNVALVLDPVADRLGWFGWSLGELPSDGGSGRGMVTASADGVRAGRGRRAAAAGLVALGVAAGGMGGYWVAHQRAEQPPASGSLAAEVLRQRTEIQNLHRVMERTRQALLQEQGTVRDLQGQLDAAKNDLHGARKALREARRNVPATIVFHYRVKPGDTLWNLAGTFYDDPTAWPKIVKANAGSIPDPDHLLVGQILKITITT